MPFLKQCIRLASDLVRILLNYSIVCLVLVWFKLIIPHRFLCSLANLLISSFLVMDAELLQFILGLDNRYSVAHVARSVELAATCLNISASDDVFAT